MVTNVLASQDWVLPMVPESSGRRELPPHHFTAVGNPEEPSSGVAMICVEDGVLHSHLALELRSKGYHVIAARSLEEAFVRSVTADPEVILSDNLAVIAQARALVDAQSVRLCAVVAPNDPNAQLDAYLCGATEVVAHLGVVN